MQVVISPLGAVRGIDGRQFLITPQVFHVLKSNQIDLPIELEHTGPAIGWVKNSSLHVQDDQIMGVAEFNAAGKAALQDKAYRYLSPTYLTDEKNNVITIAALGLVNKPNILKQALNTMQGVYMSEIQTPPKTSTTQAIEALKAMMEDKSPQEDKAKEEAQKEAQKQTQKDKEAEALSLEKLHKRLEGLEKGLNELLGVLNALVKHNTESKPNAPQESKSDPKLLEAHQSALQTMIEHNAILPKRIAQLQQMSGSPDFARFAQIYTLEANSIYKNLTEAAPVLSPLEQEVNAQLSAFMPIEPKS